MKEELILTEDWVRSVRRCKGTGCRFVCADNGREGIPYHRL